MHINLKIEKPSCTFPLASHALHSAIQGSTCRHGCLSNMVIDLPCSVLKCRNWYCTNFGVHIDCKFGSTFGTDCSSNKYIIEKGPEWPDFDLQLVWSGEGSIFCYPARLYGDDNPSLHQGRWKFTPSLLAPIWSVKGKSCFSPRSKWLRPLVRFGLGWLPKSSYLCCFIVLQKKPFLCFLSFIVTVCFLE